MEDLLSMEDLIGRLPVRRPSTRGPSSRPNSPRPTGVKPKKNNTTPLKYLADDSSSFKISDNLSDSCKTHCKICGKAFFLSNMRSHSLKSHSIQITRYKEMYGQFEIIEKVFHKCHLCGKIVLMDSDILGGHIKGTHKMKEKAYKEKYCISKPTAGVKKSKVMTDEEEPLNSFADKTSLVGQLAKLEKEHSVENVNNEVSCSDGEPTKMMEEREDQHKSFLNDGWVGDNVMGMGLGEEGIDEELEEEGMDVELEEYMEKQEFSNMLPGAEEEEQIRLNTAFGQ